MNMHTIQLKINDSVYERLLNLLSQFKKEEVEIISNDTEFETNKAYLQKEYADIVAEGTVFYSQEEFEAELDKVISKYEDKI